MNPALQALAAAALLAAPPASAASSGPLTWTPCGGPAASSGEIAARTQCAVLVVPRDYASPASGVIALGVVRVAASDIDGATHAGAVLLEPDEFADPVETLLPAIASEWLNGDAAWRKAARQFDLIGLAARRMDDAHGKDCVSATSSLPHHASLGSDTSFSNAMMAEDLARALATACQNDPAHAIIGVEPRVQDVERLREALALPALHLIGIGHGGWVAARYAARYPQHVERMLLDSAWDMDGSVAEAMEARVQERGRRIRRIVAALGADTNAIHRRIEMLPPVAYARWVGHIGDVHDLSAVLAMGRLLEQDRTLSAHDLRGALATMPLGVDEHAIRRAADRLLERLDADGMDDPYGFGPRAVGSPPALVASVFASRCNDGSWGQSQRYWRERTRELREAWPFAVNNETFQGMVCSVWPRATGRAPSVPMLDGVPPFLMLHAEFDDEAPLHNAAMALHGHDNASMVVARGLHAHGVLLRKDQPCLSAAAGRFLTDGVMPSAKLTNCRSSTPAGGR